MGRILTLNRDAPGCHGLVGFWPIANGTSEESFDLVNNRYLRRDNVDASLLTTGEETTHDGVWMPYIYPVSNAHARIDFTPTVDIGGAGSPFSFLIWMYPTNTGNRGLFEGGGSNPTRFYCYLDPMSLFVGLGSTYDSNMSDYVYNKWQMVAITYDGSTFYSSIDGLAEEAGGSGTLTLGDGDSITIGG